MQAKAVKVLETLTSGFHDEEVYFSDGSARTVSVSSDVRLGDRPWVLMRGNGLSGQATLVPCVRYTLRSGDKELLTLVADIELSLYSFLVMCEEADQDATT